MYFVSYFVATVFDCSGKPFASRADCKFIKISHFEVVELDKAAVLNSH
jgi:hypothetical protein